MCVGEPKANLPKVLQKFFGGLFLFFNQNYDLAHFFLYLSNTSICLVN